MNSPDCRSVLRHTRSNFFAAFRFLPKEKTEALYRVYAFFRIIDDCVDEPRTAAEKERALRYWQDEFVKVCENKNAHPVIIEIREVMERYHIPKEYFLGLIEGCALDISKTRYQNFQELYDYCYKVAGLVGLTCMKIFEYESPSAEKMAVDLGLAFQLTNIIRDLKADLELGRIYLPLDDLKNHGYSEDLFLRRVENLGFLSLIRHYAQLAEQYYESAFHEFKSDRDNKLKAARIMADYYRAILRKMVRKDFPVWRYQVRLNIAEKMWLLIPHLLG